MVKFPTSKREVGKMISKTTVLYGEYDITIDEKNRLLIPAEVRRSLDPERDGEAFFVIIGQNLRPWLYPERGYEQLVSKHMNVIASQRKPKVSTRNGTSAKSVSNICCPKYRANILPIISV